MKQGKNAHSAGDVWPVQTPCNPFDIDDHQTISECSQCVYA